MSARLCACGCGASLAGMRSDAEYHSPACRMRRNRDDSANKARTRPTDRDRILTALREAGTQGLHSHDVRRRGLSGHPSERCKELEERGYTIRREREYRDGRNGTRFYLVNEPTLTVGISAGRSDDRQGESLSRCRENPVASADPGGQSARSDTDAPSPQGMDRPPMPVPSDGVEGDSPAAVSRAAGETRLFEPPAPEPLSAFTDAEAA